MQFFMLYNKSTTNHTDGICLLGGCRMGKLEHLCQQTRCQRSLQR